MAAQREATFAGRRTGGNIKEEIGEDLTTVIDPIDIWQTGREDCERAQDEQVGIDIGNRVGDDALQDFRELVLDELGEGGDYPQILSILKLIF